jgi:hypothetical protein
MKLLTILRLMKQHPQSKQHPQPARVARAPSYEECLSFVMANLGHSRDGLVNAQLSAKNKQRFNQMERKADALDFERYRDILRRVVAPGLQDVAIESKTLVELLNGELREFFKRYEMLSWQVVPGRATKLEVCWTLSHRFFLPWLALRMALHLTEAGEIDTAGDDLWLIPKRGEGLHSFVMRVIDQYVRVENESNAHLARRFYGHFPKEKQERHALALEGNLSKYTNLDTTPPDATINLIVQRSQGVPHLRLKLVLARFIDRCLREAQTVFNEGQLLDLLNYFALCFTHFRSVIEQVRSEMPPTAQGNVWLWLSSRTFMGNTPGQDERFYPLMDDFMCLLPRKINAELRRAEHNGKLCRIPRNEPELNAGRWSFGQHIAIPKSIECAPFHATVQAAVNDSRRCFHGRINVATANQAKRRFEFLGLGSFTMVAEKRQPLCNDVDAKMAEAECKRLFQLIYKQTPASKRADVALEYLKYVVAPYRPKADEDRKLAKELLKVADKGLRQNKLLGAVHYLHGCLLALEENYGEVLRSYVSARTLGHESCGEFWIDLLLYGLVTAVRVDSVRERKNFAKHARLYGIFSNDATPRTNEMQAQMKTDDFRRVWQAGFSPFPLRKASKQK